MTQTPEDPDLTAEELYERFYPTNQPARVAQPEPPEPTTTRTEVEQSRAELKVFHAATHETDPTRLLNSEAFQASLRDLGTDISEDFAAALTDLDPALEAAIRASIETTPTGAAPSRLPQPNPAQGSSGSGPAHDGEPEYDLYFPTTK